MRICAQNSLITNDHDASDGGTFSLFPSFVSSSTTFLFFLSNDGPVDHPSLNGLKAKTTTDVDKGCIRV